VNVGCGVGLLEEEMATLQRHVELNTSRADELSILSLDLLKSVEESVSLLDHILFELNVTGNQLQDSVGIINHNLDRARDNSAAAEILSSMSGALLTRASHQQKVENNTHQSALHVLSEVSFIKERVNTTLEEANRIIREGEVQHAHTTEIEEVHAGEPL
jgi:hypothetical protein